MTNGDISDSIVDFDDIAFEDADGNELSPEEIRLAKLIYGIDHDLEYVNSCMELAYSLNLIEECADFIGEKGECSVSDLSDFFRDHTEVEFVDEDEDELFYKEDEADTIWWLDNSGTIGEYVFSFDKQKTYNLFADYPHELSVEEWLIFNRENAYWAEFFKDRNEEYAKEHAEEIEKYTGKAPQQQASFQP